MLVIRMQRVGRKNDPAFRVVLTERRSKPQSGQQEILGSYHPKTKQTVLKNERILYWKSKGAQVSPSVRHLLSSQNKKVSVITLPPVKEETKGDSTVSVSEV
jgi:small subunit ribosomal protein S16